jgi:hypothetical protein
MVERGEGDEYNDATPLGNHDAPKELVTLSKFIDCPSDCLSISTFLIVINKEIGTKIKTERKDETEELAQSCHTLRLRQLQNAIAI